MFWTKQEDDQLRAMYVTVTNSEIAQRIGRTVPAICGRATKLGLRGSKSHEIMGRFQPGFTPHNKGVPMPDNIRKKVARTWFKKGESNCVKPVGIETIRKDKSGSLYRMIKLGNKHWEYKARHVWQQAHGTIPKGILIHHKNGDTLDDRLENLEAITRKENRFRNAAHQTLSDKFILNCLAWRDKPHQQKLQQHKDLINLKRAQIQLNRALNLKEQ